MKRHDTLRTVAAVTGVLWGITYFGMNAIGWGRPGSEAYERYELYNRALGLLLVVLTAVTASMVPIVRPFVPRYGSRGLSAAAAGLAVMVLGSALEFWVFTLTPYSPGSLRGLGWLAYCIGLLVFYLGGAALGIALIRRPGFRMAGAAFAIWLPLAALAAAAGSLLGRDLPSLSAGVAVSGLAYVSLALRLPRLAD